MFFRTGSGTKCICRYDLRNGRRMSISFRLFWNKVCPEFLDRQWGSNRSPETLITVHQNVHAPLTRCMNVFVSDMVPDWGKSKAIFPVTWPYSCRLVPHFVNRNCTHHLFIVKTDTLLKNLTARLNQQGSITLSWSKNRIIFQFYYDKD